MHDQIDPADRARIGPRRLCHLERGGSRPVGHDSRWKRLVRVSREFPVLTQAIEQDRIVCVLGGYFSTGTTYLTRLLGRTFATGSRNNAKTTEDARSKYYAIGGSSSTGERGVAAQKAPMPLVIFEENLLNLAEAGLRTKGFAEGLLQLNKVRAYLNTRGSAFTPIGTTDTVKYDPYLAADFQASGLENRTNLTQEKALLREIIEERYVSLYGQILPFNDFRRLAKSDADVRPVLPFNSTVATKHPERLIYAQTEINGNPNLPRPIPDIFQVTEVNK